MLEDDFLKIIFKNGKNKKRNVMEKKDKFLDNKKSQEIDLPKIINSEVNLLVFPFFALTKKNNKKMTKVEYRDVIKRDNKKIEILWQVSSNSEFGYPGLFDREVHKTIEQIITEILQKKGVIENPISFSIYNLCERMNISKSGGKNYSMVRKSLERIRMTGIKSEGAFYNKGRKQWQRNSQIIRPRFV